MNSTINSTSKKRRKINFNNLSLYSMLIPGFVFFLVFSYIPMGFLVVAFQKYSAGKGIFASEVIGLTNFISLVDDNFFHIVLSNTLIINIMKIILCFPMPIILALLVNEIDNGLAKKVIQSAMFLPHFISWVVVLGLMISIFSVNSGLLNKLIMSFGAEPVAFLGTKSLYRSYLVVTEIWKEAGWSSIIYIAALTGINPSLYEASRVDGATKLQQIRHVSLPGISNTIIVILILSLGGLLSNSFEQVFVTINPAVYEVGEIIPTYVFHKGLEQFKVSYAAAVGLFQSVIGFVLVFGTNVMSRKLGGNSLW